MRSHKLPVPLLAPALSVLIPAVARIFPDAKFLIALRDPRDVYLVCFMQPVFTRAIGRWQNYEHHLAPWLATLDPFIKRFGYE